MDTTLSTDSVRSPERIAYWTDMICNVYVQLGCDAKATDDFHGHIINHRLPSLDMSVVSSKAQRVQRTDSHIARAVDDYFLVSIQTKGVGVIRQDGRDAVIKPGDFALYDSTRRYELLFQDDFEQIVLKIGGDRLRSVVRDTEKLTATPVSGSNVAGRLMVDMINTLRRDVSMLEPASGLAVANGVISILVAGLQSLPMARRESLPQLTEFHLTRIKQMIQSQLADPELSVSSLARQLNLSPGHVHRVFKNEGSSLSHYIWSSRLDACSRDLLDPRRAGASVGEIAFSWGFNDAAHFSRAFKEKFNCSPREWRQRGG